MPDAYCHNPISAHARHMTRKLHSLTLTDQGGEVKIFTTALRVRAMKAAFDNPAPDLLAMIDPRLLDVGQTEDGLFTYRGCIVMANPHFGFDWFDRDGSPDGGGCSGTFFEALSDIDEHREAVAAKAAEPAE